MAFLNKLGRLFSKKTRVRGPFLTMGEIYPLGVKFVCSPLHSSKQKSVHPWG
jgi:hypothetical protein